MKTRIPLIALKRARKRLGYSMEQMSELLGFRDKSHYNKYELGLYEPKRTFMFLCSKILKVSIQELFFDEFELIAQKKETN